MFRVINQAVAAAIKHSSPYLYVRVLPWFSIGCTAAVSSLGSVSPRAVKLVATPFDSEKFRQAEKSLHHAHRPRYIINIPP